MFILHLLQYMFILPTLDCLFSSVESNYVKFIFDLNWNMFYIAIFKLSPKATGCNFSALK